VVLEADLELHALGLGKIIGNLHSLELLLREFLAKTARKVDPSCPPMPSILMLKVGDEIPETPFTNYDDLRTIIRRYNQAIPSSAHALSVDESVVEVRDAVAHGRVLAPVTGTQLYLFKFSRPSAGKVTVTHAIAVTEEWLAQERARIRKECLKVLKAHELVDT